MRNVFDMIKKSHGAQEEDLAAKAVQYSSGENARRTKALMGNLTPEEEQLVNTETAKGGIARRFMQDQSLGMYQKPGFTDTLPGGLGGAQQRQADGKMTLDDALALGLRSSRYGDYGTVREERRDQTMVQGYRGAGMQDKSRTVSRPKTAEEWLAEQNKPALDSQAAEQAMIAAGVQAGSLIPTLDAQGQISGYEPKQAPDKFMSTAAGVFNATTGQMVEGTGKPDPSPLYPYKEGMPAQVMLPGGIPGVVDTEGKFYKPQRISYTMQDVQDENGHWVQRAVPNVPVGELKNYNDLANPKPEGAAAGAAGELPTPQTQADFDALPKGAKYIDPDDGKTYVK